LSKVHVNITSNLFRTQQSVVAAATRSLAPAVSPQKLGARDID